MRLSDVAQIAGAELMHSRGTTQRLPLNARVLAARDLTQQLPRGLPSLGECDLACSAELRFALLASVRAVEHHEHAAAGRCDLAEQPALLGIP
jgi:hypothetical protein